MLIVNISAQWPWGRCPAPSTAWPRTNDSSPGNFEPSPRGSQRVVWHWFWMKIEFGPHFRLQNANGFPRKVQGGQFPPISRSLIFLSRSLSYSLFLLFQGQWFCVSLSGNVSCMHCATGNDNGRFHAFGVRFCGGKEREWSHFCLSYCVWERVRGHGSIAGWHGSNTVTTTSQPIASQIFAFVTNL